MEMKGQFGKQHTHIWKDTDRERYIGTHRPVLSTLIGSSLQGSQGEKGLSHQLLMGRWCQGLGLELSGCKAGPLPTEIQAHTPKVRFCIPRDPSSHDTHLDDTASEGALTQLHSSLHRTLVSKLNVGIPATTGGAVKVTWGQFASF